MVKTADNWDCVAYPEGSPDFPFAVKSNGRIICLVKRHEDAGFIAHARDVLPRLVGELNLLMSGVDNIRNFIHALDSDLKDLDVEMKKRL